MALRKQYGAEIFPAGVQATVERIGGLRSQVPATQPGGGGPALPDTPPPDTSSGNVGGGEQG